MIHLLMERDYATWRTNWDTTDGLTVVPGFFQVQEQHVSPCKMSVLENTTYTFTKQIQESAAILTVQTTK